MKIKLVGNVSLLTIFGVITLTCCILPPIETLVLKTGAGKVHGKLINDGKVSAYQGVPYAAQPVGKLRCQSPPPVLSWNSLGEEEHCGIRRRP